MAVFGNTYILSNLSGMPPGGMTRGGPPLPRPVIPRERGVMDRVVEYLVGDGPSNRYYTQIRFF